MNLARRPLLLAAALAALAAAGLASTLLAGNANSELTGSAMPSLAGAERWLNSAPLDTHSLKGKVVLVDFWTWDCSNCQRSLPYVKQWAERYADRGLVVVGVHTPEYDHERDISTLRSRVKQLGIGYPVAVDNQRRIWNAWGNQFWPAHYFVDRNGQVRAVHFGEGRYEEQERVIQALLDAG